VFYSCLLIVALIVFILGCVLNPSFVSKHLSPDGAIGKAAIIKIYIMESFVLTLGVILFFYSLIEIIKSDYAIRISEKTLGYAMKIDENINSILIFLKFYKKDDSLLLQRVILIWIIILLISLVSGLLDVSFSWEKASGYEYLWIAQTIEAGHGFSMDGHFPTAHEEPLYPFFMAFTTKIFGKYGRLVILILQVVALFITSVVIYLLARKVFNYSTGILAGLILPLTPGVKSLSYSFGPPIFAGLMISVSVYLIIRCSEDLSMRRGILLGFILGLSSLLYAPILLFIPLSILYLLITMRPYSPVVGKTALAILVSAIIAVSPWTVRNYLVFGHFIPLKTGLGIIAIESNPILASTFTSGDHACANDFVPPWESSNAWQALKMSSSQHGDLSAKKVACIEPAEREALVRLNEVEINKVYMKKTIDFMISQPLTFAALAFYRILFFFSFNKGVISMLFVISILLTLRNKRSWLLLLFVLAYIAIYLLIVPFWYRYRYPIEPILITVASYFPAIVLSKFHAFLQGT